MILIAQGHIVLKNVRQKWEACQESFRRCVSFKPGIGSHFFEEIKEEPNSLGLSMRQKEKRRVKPRSYPPKTIKKVF